MTREITKYEINKLPVITILAKILPVSSTTTVFSFYLCFFFSIIFAFGY